MLDVSRALKNPGQVFPFEATVEIDEMEVLSDPVHFVDVRVEGEYLCTGDNRISLKISRQDGSVFYEKEWTKDDFASYLDESYKKGGILEAMIFDHVQGTEMRFAVSVCKPESGDEFIPLVLTVNSTKGIASSLFKARRIVLFLCLF